MVAMAGHHRQRRVARLLGLVRGSSVESREHEWGRRHGKRLSLGSRSGRCGTVFLEAIHRSITSSLVVSRLISSTVSTTDTLGVGTMLTAAAQVAVGGIEDALVTRIAVGGGAAGVAEDVPVLVAVLIGWA
jgi:hypothetical protein